MTRPLLCLHPTPPRQKEKKGSLLPQQMDVYPQELVIHEAPLVVVSGLAGRDRHSEIPPYPLLNSGPHVSSSLPALEDDTALRLVDCFQKHDATGLWGRRPPRDGKAPQLPVFRIRLVGREYWLPVRKANPPSPGASGSPTEGPPTRVLHSPISPLSPDSPLYPDGTVSHIWLRKHQSLLPAVFVSCHQLNTETSDAGLQAVEDNRMIEAINGVKKHFLSTSTGSLTAASAIGSEELRSSGHRTKFVAIIECERSVMTSAQIDDRLTYIRRGTGLITNTTFFVIQSNTSPVEQEQFVSSFLATIYPGAVEYYREMSKHSRRKRNKGSIPPPTIPSSRALSSQGWNLRYEFKLGVFAEFRQEMDVAGRNYETAYEKLLVEVFEATSSWTERWTEARMLADILAIRIVRCYLWVENYVAAKQRWSYHISRMKDVIDRRGKGSDTYGFAAWLSRWNKCLADLLHLANLPVFSVNISPVRTTGLLDAEPPTIYFRPDRVGERLISQELLHHPGFYYLAASEWTKIREARARRIDMDNKDLYDTYLCPPPHEEREFQHATLQMSYLALARTEFDLRKQERMVEAVSYQLAKLRMLKAPENPSFWVEALKDLRSIASRYRREGWWGLLEDVLWRIIECGRHAGDAGSIVLAEFELLCKPVFRQITSKKYDLGKCLEGVDTSNVKPTIVARASDVVNILSVSYSFEFPEVHAGQPVNSQLSITSNAHPSSAPLVFSELKITYEGGLKTILLRHDPSVTVDPSPSVRIISLQSSLHEFTEQDASGPLHSPTSIASHTHLVADTDLSIAPGQTKIYELSAILREAGTAKAICGTFGMVNDSFDLDFVVMFGEDEISSAVHPLPIKNINTTPNGGKGVWWKQDADGKITKRPLRSATESLTILPRPPKMEVFPRGLKHGVYTDEIVKIGLEVVNAEDEDAVVGVDVRILGWPTEEEPEITWLSPDGTALPPLPSLHPLGSLKPSEHTTQYFTFASPRIPAECTLSIKLRYTLISDRETTTEKVVSVDMPITAPFHITYDFSPRVHHGPWSDYFTIPSDASKPQGIVQRWCLTANVQGLTIDDITIEGWDLSLQAVAGAAECKISTQARKAITLSQNQTANIPFLLDIHKHTLEDRSPSNIDTTLQLRWCRQSTSQNTTTTTAAPVPRLFVPLREPRVLAEAKPSATIPGVIDLAYTVENPTNYFLTFALLMETNDAFAFSGQKQGSLQLLPVSRERIEYRIVPYQRNTWVRPQLRVVDRYFNKTLKTAPGLGCRGEKVGVGVWVPEEMLAVEEEAAAATEEKAKGERKEEDSDEDDADHEQDSGSSEDSLEYRRGSDEESEEADAEAGEAVQKEAEPKEEAPKGEAEEEQNPTQEKKEEAEETKEGEQ
ncbi:Gryzun, putative trafficking through golgi-domain-containing protein [Sphaerosporella brunnea]|uniref:Gryzun, putative trafficking through golgi-domain-containing protein n=1 Tax=Sphaerosporella brunnea TaxID=1250544 RepID=A0A5J5EIF3_9PEZI|nr:Gryzun, putative trafficking through golgi-domain-containing protein [Sphaerosporella brunnea]